MVAIACTHAHDDHVRCAPDLAEQVSAPVLLHRDDRVLWDLVHSRHEPDGALREVRRQCRIATAQGIDMTKDEARAIVYGMPYADWVAQHQTTADAGKQTAFAAALRANVGDTPPE